MKYAPFAYYGIAALNAYQILNYLNRGNFPFAVLFASLTVYFIVRGRQIRKDYPL